MAYNTTAPMSGEFHYLAEIDLSGTTLRFADEDISIVTGPSTGFFYAGRLPSMGTLVRDLGTFVEPKEAINSYQLAVDNSDGHMQELINQYSFANKEVRIFLGEGDYKSSYAEVYRGNVALPNGVSWDEDAATITIIDPRIKNRRFLPGPSFFLTDYSTVEDRYKNAKIPIIYGNWSSAAGSGLSIPVACSNKNTLTFKAACHGLKAIDRYLKNSVVIAAGNIKDVSLSAATFRISGVTYDTSLDTVSINCQGMPTINGTLIERPGGVLRSLLTAWIGLTATDLNVTAFNTIDTDTGDEVVRRFIGNETSSETLVSELLNESAVDLRFVQGKYSPKYRSLDLESESVQIYEEDILSRSDMPERGDFSVERDPDRFYANRLRFRYQYDPLNDKYNQKLVINAVYEQSEHGAIVERLLDFNWYYDSITTESRGRRELTTFSSEPLNIRFGSTKRMMGLNLADQVRMNYNIFDNRAVQIRRLENDFNDMTVRISGFTLFMQGIGHWTDDVAPSWSMAGAIQKDEQGFWCDATGWASSAADPTSYLASRWY